MACPYFTPTQRLNGAGWIHPSRLPLGSGWSGICSAPGHEGTQPSEDALRELCNLGYAAGCACLPKDRVYDAVRFAIAQESQSELILWFACEIAHRPAAVGTVRYDLLHRRWSASHKDAAIQKLAECYLESHFARKRKGTDDSPPPHD